MLPFHRLETLEPLPESFTNPFCYAPCGIVQVAGRELMEYLDSREEWREELDRGKMFGVLVVRNSESELGYLCAFSGNLAGQTQHEHFVPPIFDLNSTETFFRVEESRISEINAEIKALESDAELVNLKSQLAIQSSESAQKIAEYRAIIKSSKIQRNAIRQTTSDQDIISKLTKESQHQKAELKRIEHREAQKISLLESQLSTHTNKISELKSLRQTLSQELQQRLFESYIIHNFKGDKESIFSIFKRERGVLPPAGTGECAAPKLLNYAYINSLIPIAMGEFWWGESPMGEVRHHGEYYTACKSKCEPLLNYMLTGLNVESQSQNYAINRDVKILYQDSWLAVVDKPAGMLSVKGKGGDISVESLLSALFPYASEAKVVHRLDMDTSGLLVISFNADVYRELQRQFAMREVTKEYVAILDGTLPNDAGTISLPLRPNFEERPRQMVDYISGKEAITNYRVISHTNTQTRISLTPHTGRTHQLRVHCAHTQGLNSPIVGDRLYGKPSRRLMLHAEKIAFRHPITREVIGVESPAEF